MTPDGHDSFRFAVLASDIVLFTLKDGVLLVRLIEVNRPPHFPGIPGLPGGLIDAKESAEAAAIRHLEARAGISAKSVYMEQLATFSAVDRDPRSRAVAVAYLACVPWESLSDKERADSKESWWAPVLEKTSLAYDHDEVLRTAVRRLELRATYTTLLGKLMPESFTLTELEKAYECVLDKPLDKRNFRKKILKLKILQELPEKRRGGRARPAALYSFRSPAVEEIEVL